MSADKPTEASGESSAIQPASPFASLGNFKAKGASTPDKVTKEIQKDIDQVAAQNGFHSREAKPAQPAKTKRFNAAEPKKQLNIKIPVPMHDRYYQMAEERGIKVLHELLGDALDALVELEALKAAKDNKE